jgi:hypothetical protein
MNQNETGGPAFPLSTIDPHERSVTTCDGMTLRDFFAAKAMQANRARNSSYASWDDLAKDAYELADAMLKERNK